MAKIRNWFSESSEKLHLYDYALNHFKDRLNKQLLKKAEMIVTKGDIETVIDDKKGEMIDSIGPSELKGLERFDIAEKGLFLREMKIFLAHTYLLLAYTKKYLNSSNKKMLDSVKNIKLYNEGFMRYNIALVCYWLKGDTKLLPPEFQRLISEVQNLVFSEKIVADWYDEMWSQ